MSYKKQRDIEKVLKQYPSLNIKEGVLFGYLKVDEDDEYEIEIKIGDFPRRFPIVKEIEGRIPRNVDRHKYSNDVCCLTTDAYELLLLRKHIVSNLAEFINKVVVPFFQNNSYFEINGEYKEGEYTHGTLGNIESYSDILKIRNPEIVIDSLIKRLKNVRIGVNSTCICGSGKKFKNCHQRRFNDLYLIDEEIIKRDLDGLKKILQTVSK